MVLLLRRVMPFVRPGYRQFAKAKVQEKVHPKLKKLKEIQKKFCVDDGVPVYLKNGVTDKLMYQASWALVIVGLGLSVQTFVQLVLKAHQECSGEDCKQESEA